MKKEISPEGEVIRRGRSKHQSTTSYFKLQSLNLKYFKTYSTKLHTYYHVLLAIVHGTTMILQKKAFKAKWYYCIALAWVDVEANFLVVKAYHYTSITSVMLLDCFTIPCAIIFTWFFLKTKYRFKKLTGAVICIAGLVIVIFSDVHASDRAGGSSPLKGDLFVIVGSILYAASNVSEFALWNVIILSYGKLSGSAMLNLSLLTSDMWAVLIRIFAYHQKVDWMYFMAFAAVVVGLIIYSGGGKGDEQHYAEIADEDAERSRYFDEKAGLLGNSDHSSIVGGSRIGDSSKHGSASSGIARQDDSDNKRMEKDAQWKTG
ncbi:uncharacterized protein LOC104879428 [Vitis vinifera]|nr:uncharacterized protein LOC104879428 [Vitis vinifera]|eukprot:XP_010650501.1 PREDICTED: solute carrier family 35 member F1 [Vitis vinifera]